MTDEMSSALTYYFLVYKEEMLLWLAERVPYDTGKLARNLDVEPIFNRGSIGFKFTSVPYFTYAMKYQNQTLGHDYIQECVNKYGVKIYKEAIVEVLNKKFKGVFG